VRERSCWLDSRLPSRYLSLVLVQALTLTRGRGLASRTRIPAPSSPDSWMPLGKAVWNAVGNQAIIHDTEDRQIGQPRQELRTCAGTPQRCRPTRRERALVSVTSCT